MITKRTFYRIFFVFVLLINLHLTGFTQVNTKRFLAMGRTDLFNDNYTESIKNLTVAVNAAPDKFEPYFYRGLAKYSLGDYNGAIADLNKSISINAYFSYSYLYRGLCKQQQKKFHEALKDYADAIHRGPNNPDIYVNRGAAKLQLKLYQSAIVDFDTALILDSKNENAYLNKGLALYELKKMDEALEEINKAIKLNYLNKTAYLRRGILKFGMKKYEEAIFDFELSMKLDDADPLLYYFRAISYYSLEDKKNAYKDYAKVLELDPNNALTYYNRAILKTEDKNYLGALLDYEKVTNINPTNIYGYYNKANVKSLMGDLKGAIKDYDKAIELFPDFARAYLNRSSLKEKLNDKKGAYTDYLKAEVIREKFDRSDSISEMFKDSLQLTKLIAFESDFNNANADNGYIQFKNVYIELESNFNISMLAKDEEDYIDERRKQYFVPEIAEYNESNLSQYKLAFGLTKEINLLHPTKAKEILQRLNSALKDQPNNPYNHLYIGILNERIGNLPSAERSYLEAVKLDPTFGFAYLNLANVAYLISMEKISQDTSSQENLINENIEDLKKRVNPFEIPNLKKAIQYYDMAMQIYPKLGFIYYNRANLYSKTQEYMKAINDYNQALILQPNLAEAYYNRGLTLLILQDNAAACPDLSKSGELGITNAYNVIKRFCSETK
ncbi:MAG: tetratricopeptide repeat protein [Bacteroidales bacterium]|jgi:tetratricopeptide (TPR) repeat protein|nr:tetratricopeptide repeat protein [Bacteroidales bacterium]